MEVPPRWCANKMDCWSVMTDEWCSDNWLVVHNDGKAWQAKMVGVAHHQGSANLLAYDEKWPDFHNKPVPEVYDTYSMANRASYKKAKSLSEGDVDPKEYTNIFARDKLKKYKEVELEKFGEAYDPVKEPIDTEVVMISGGGRPHGAIAMGDGLIRCPYTPPQIKACQTSSSPAIRIRAWPVDLAIEAALEKERQATQELLAERDRMLAERDRKAAKDLALAEERTQRMLKEERAWNEAANKAIYDLFATMFESQDIATDLWCGITPRLHRITLLPILARATHLVILSRDVDSDLLLGWTFLASLCPELLLCAQTLNLYMCTC